MVRPRVRPRVHPGRWRRCGAGSLARIGCLAGAVGLLTAACTDDSGAAEDGGSEGETADGPTGDAGDGDGDAGDGDGGDDGANDGGDGDGGDGDGDGDPEPPLEPGIFVAVGDGGRRAWSDDGQSWQVVVGSGDFSGDNDLPDALDGICAGDGYLLAVGGGGNQHNGNTMIMRSADGESWEEDLVASEEQRLQLNACAIAPELAVAVGRRSSVYLSTDAGYAWTRVHEFADNGNGQLFDVAVIGPEGGAAVDQTIVAVGQSDDEATQSKRLPAIVVSEDLGASWETIFPDLSGAPKHLAAGGGWTMVLSDSACLRSADLDSWEPCEPPIVEPFGVNFVGGRFIVFGPDHYARSEVGESWNVTSDVVHGMPSAMTFGEGRFVGVQWGRRGWAEALSEWSYEADFAHPLVDVTFLPD